MVGQILQLAGLTVVGAEADEIGLSPWPFPGRKHFGGLGKAGRVRKYGFWGSLDGNI